MRYQHTNSNTSHNRSSGFSSVAEIAGGMGLQPSPRQQDNPALSTIVDHGGHLVLVKRGERSPVWFKWQKLKPAPDVVAAHNGRVGLIPHSIGATALDVDFGDPSNLPKPWVGCRSRRPGGVHLYYGDDQARGNQNWQAAGCSGEVRSTNISSIPRGPGKLDDAVRIIVDLPPGTGKGPVVSPNLNRYGVQSAPLYRGLLNLAYQWFDPGRTRRPVRGGKHWLQVEDPERYPTKTDDLLIELFYPTSTVKNRTVLTTRARQHLAQLVKDGEARIVKGRLLPPAPRE